MTTFVLVQRGSWPGWAPGTADLYLAFDCAAALFTARRDYRAETGRHDADLAEPAGAKRSIEQVRAMRAAFLARDLATMEFYNMSTTSTAPPSLTSPHLTGYSFDVASDAFQKWLVVNHARYGVRQTLVKENDPRHWQFFPGTATVALDVTSLDNGAAAPESRSLVENIRLLWIQWKGSDADDKRVFYRLDLRNGTYEDSQYTQAQANASATLNVAPTIPVASQAALDALVVVVKAEAKYRTTTVVSSGPAPTPEQVAAAVDTALKDDFAGVAAAIKANSPTEVVAALKAAL